MPLLRTGALRRPNSRPFSRHRDRTDLLRSGGRIDNESKSPQLLIISALTPSRRACDLPSRRTIDERTGLLDEKASFPPPDSRGPDKTWKVYKILLDGMRGRCLWYFREPSGQLLDAGEMCRNAVIPFPAFSSGNKAPVSADFLASLVFLLKPYS